VQRAPGIPHALYGAEDKRTARALRVARREVVFVIGSLTIESVAKCCDCAMPQPYSEASLMEPESCGVLDTPLSRNMTVLVRGRCDAQFRLRHSGMARQRQTRNLEIPGSMLRIAPE
jgi:hypothetical protein